MSNLIVDNFLQSLYTMYSMLNTTHFSATEARKNFFEILRLAKNGQKITIDKQDEDIVFHITTSLKVSPAKKQSILANMKTIHAYSLSPQRIKDLILTKYDSKKYLY